MKKENFVYPVIDTRLTGGKIKNECDRKNISVKQLQNYLGIGAFQSIYDWFKGKSLPSLDNMLALSRLPEVPMEELIVCENADTLMTYEVVVPGRKYLTLLEEYKRRFAYMTA